MENVEFDMKNQIYLLPNLKEVLIPQLNHKLPDCIQLSSGKMRYKEDPNLEMIKVQQEMDYLVESKLS